MRQKKKIWKRKWREEGVSPVIATILMVAITVVLAAVLYLLVSGIINIGPTNDPNIQISSGISPGPGQWKLEISGASRAETINGFNVVVLKNLTSIVIGKQSLTNITGPNCSGSPGISYMDLQSDGKVNMGDWFTLCGADSASEYQVQLLWKESGNKVSGDTGKIRQ